MNHDREKALVRADRVGREADRVVPLVDPQLLDARAVDRHGQKHAGVAGFTVGDADHAWVYCSGRSGGRIVLRSRAPVAHETIERICGAWLLFRASPVAVGGLIVAPPEGVDEALDHAFLVVV